MGVGDPLDARFPLSGPLPAGTWHLVGDGIILRDVVDMRFDVLWKTAAEEQVIVSFEHRFERTDNNYAAIAYEADATGAAVPAKAGDLLVLRMTATGSIAGSSYIPNGDGSLTKGRIPSLTLP